MTLVELLVALTVATIGLAGLLSLYTVITRGNAVSADTSQAIDLASQMVEDLGAMSVSQIEALDAYGPIDATGWGPTPYHQGDIRGRRDILFERTVDAREVFGTPSLVIIEAEVRWRDPGASDDDRPRIITLETALLREEDSS